MEQPNVTLSEAIQIQKGKHHMLSLICSSWPEAVDGRVSFRVTHSSKEEISRMQVLRMVKYEREQLISLIYITERRYAIFKRENWSTVLQSCDVYEAQQWSAKV